MQKRAFSLVTLLGVILLCSFQAYSQSCTSCSYSSNGGNNTYNLNNGQTLCITSGTFTGQINVSGSVTICISPGAFFQPRGLNNFNTGSIINNNGTFKTANSIVLSGGTLNNNGVMEATSAINFGSMTFNNYGSFVSTAALTFSGTTINNYNSLQFANTVNMNSGTKWLNQPNAYARFDQNFTINSGSTFINQGTQEFYKELTLSANNTFTNLGRLHTYDNLNLYGTFNNSATVVAKGPVSIYNGKTTNSCRFVTVSSFTNSSTFENNAVMWVTENAKFTNTGNFTNSNYIRMSSFTNSGNIDNAGGQLGVEGTSLFSGYMAGGILSDVGNDSNNYRFDSYSGTITSATGFIALKDTANMGLGTCGFVSLPVRILDFNAKPTDAQKVQLTWSVAEEVDLHSYIVEKLTESNGTWKAISNIWPVGNTAVKAYSYTDKLAGQAKAQYRLKIVNNDGTIAYSAIKTVQPATLSTTTVGLYPNPVAHTLTLTGLSTTARVVLYNLDGKTILSTTQASGSAVQVDMHTLKPGTYLVQIQQQGTVSYHKVIKQ